LQCDYFSYKSINIFGPLRGYFQCIPETYEAFFRYPFVIPWPKWTLSTGPMFIGRDIDYYECS